MVKACILGCSGLELTLREAEFFRKEKPLGFILFRRNIDNPDQVRRLVAELKSVAGHPDVLILIDQEGGRVARLKPPHWPPYPPSEIYGQVSHDLHEQRELVRLASRLMAHDLSELGINVDCVPVLDVPQPGAHDIIGDRAYARDPQTVAIMGRAACEGLLAGGVLPVLKHIPGHGRAGADSHLALPVVNATREDLETVDFLPFEVNADMPLAMTAHVVYAAFDRKQPATTSRRMIKVIRHDIGFDGLLMCDDLSMQALSGSMEARAKAAIRAGCDVLLHCNGEMAEMEIVAAHTPRLRGHAQRRFHAAWARLSKRIEPLDVEDGRARLMAAVARLGRPLGGQPDPTEALMAMREMGGV